MKNWTETAFLGYVAGFLDGEGCIEIDKAECNVRARLANTHKPTLQAIHERLGYGRIEEYRRPKNRRCKRLYCYAVSNAPDVEQLFLLLRPYVIIKAEKLEYALEIIQRQRDRMTALDERNRQVLDMIDQGFMQKDIANKFGISQQLVSRIKKGHTWPTEIAKFNARRNLKRGVRSSDQLFRLHGVPPTKPGPGAESNS